MISFLIHSLILLLAGHPADFPERGSGQPVYWSEDRPLTWEDFRGRTPGNSREAAAAFSGIRFGFQSNGETIRFQVIAVFEPEKSWARKGLVNQTLLVHEQKHFDITEWHARKFRMELKQLSLTNKDPGPQAGLLFKKLSRACNETQDRYDRETDHSRNQARQMEWNERISKELIQLQSETDTLLVFKSTH